MKTLFVQPVIASYRAPLLDALRSAGSVVIAAGMQEKGGGWDASSPVDHLITTRMYYFFGGRICYQGGLLKALVRERPDAVFSFGNPRFLSLWFLLILCRVRRIPVYAHGQGLYSQAKPSFMTKLAYRLLCRAATKYIAYSENGRKTLIGAGCSSKQIVVAHNSLTLSATVRPEAKTYAENGVLFIGRLRPSSGFEKLVRLVTSMRQSGSDICLHVIGDGTERWSDDDNCLDGVIFHGAIYDQDRIASISRQCRIGCYPGDAGLSVVHMFGLSLPALVHGSLHEHMGPEPEYVIPGVNGFNFKKDDSGHGLTAGLSLAWAAPPERLFEMGRSAFAMYEQLNNPPLGIRILEIILASR